ASVELIEGDKLTDTRVVFRITEGPEIKVSSIGFTGVHFVTEGRLRTQLNTSSTFLGLGGDYNPAMVDQDVAKLVEYYKTFGFHDVRVSPERQLEQADSRVKIIFHIDEGKRYRLGNIDLEGPPGMPRDLLMSHFRGKDGDIYDENVIKTNLEIVKAMEGWNGIEANVKRDLTFKPNGVVDEVYQVNERPPATVRHVIA